MTDFPPDQLAEYRQAWRKPETIRAMCEDYRAALRCDFDLDAADLGRQFTCPALFLSGADGVMNQTFDMTEVWAPRLAHMQHSTVPGGHFFADQNPKETLAHLQQFLLQNALPQQRLQY